MIHHIRHRELDRRRWDDCLAQAGFGLPYAYSWYLDVVAPGWDALVLGDYEAVFPLPWNRRLFGFRQVYQPYFAQQLGLFGRSLPDRALLETFIRALPPSFRRVKVCLNEQNAALLPPEAGWEVKTNYLLPLSPDYGSLFAGYSKSLRKRVRRAREEHALVEDPLSPVELTALYRAHQGQKLSLKEADYARVARLMQAAIDRGHGRIWGATDAAGELRVAVFFLESHGRLINLFGSSDERGRELHSMHFLLDALIERHAGSELIFDFEGSSIPSIASFFASFGSEARSYYLAGWGKWPFSQV